MTGFLYYDKKGEAVFYCPELLRLTHNKTVEKYLASLDPVERALWDGGGHTIWKFCWQKGDYHIDHVRNGGIPQCDCGRDLKFVFGGSPF